MKHDWYWTDIKFREPQLKQVDKEQRLNRLWAKQFAKFPPDQPSINRKSAGIETAIKELKDLFCNSFKRK